MTEALEKAALSVAAFAPASIAVAALVARAEAVRVRDFGAVVHPVAFGSPAVLSVVPETAPVRLPKVAIASPAAGHEAALEALVVSRIRWAMGGRPVVVTA